ncbi:hypothetical protein BHM03_00004891 [Ensete ventricosum]|uniref:Uncharacterized protein n=1 Tax=Ensete ventricosum TaxID=4639 RepID=A0A445MAX8_ENSVE|nr:hypothetical protein BHM03_00004891 [Ensete ventricosum]
MRVKAVEAQGRGPGGGQGGVHRDPEAAGGGRAGGLLSTWAGDAFGFDVSWFYSYETCAGFSTEEAGPKVVAWDKRCTEERESAANALSDPTRCTRFGIE